MKICICTTIAPTMETFVLDTVKYLYEKSGYDVTLICNEDEAFKKSLPEYIHFIPVHMKRGIDITGFKSVLDFIKIFKKEKFDLIQYATPNAACYASIAARFCKAPIRLYCQWGIRYVGLKGISRQIFKFIEKMVCSNSTNIRAVSSLNMAFAVSEGLYPETKALVVGNGGTIGVDMSKYDIHQKKTWRKAIRDTYDIQSNNFVFGFCGRISIDKGCAELLTAFKQIESEENNVNLLIVGPVEGDCGIDMNLISWARRSKNVIMTGMVDSGHMHEYYAAMDILVHPTYREGFGMVIQEAGALGIPVITTNVPGASEVMEDGISSTHIEVKNVKMLAESMKDFAHHPDKVKRFGEAAYQRTRQMYDRSIMLEYQLKDYKKLLERDR